MNATRRAQSVDRSRRRPFTGRPAKNEEEEEEDTGRGPVPNMKVSTVIRVRHFHTRYANIHNTGDLLTQEVMSSCEMCRIYQKRQTTGSSPNIKAQRYLKYVTICSTNIFMTTSGHGGDPELLAAQSVQSVETDGVHRQSAAHLRR